MVDERVLKRFPELKQLLILERKAKNHARVETLCEVACDGHRFPVKAFTFGCEDKSSSAFVIFGGVHGLEKIGTHLSLYYLRSILNQLQWDGGLRRRLEGCRLVFVPLVNPGGMFLRNRSNPNGVDLMRNAPVDGEGVPYLLGGHRKSAALPWYRGPEGAPMELESQAVVDFVKSEFYEAEALVTLDVHSGFGMRDQLWYPYAKSQGPFPELTNVKKMVSLLRKAHPFHVYKVEPQSRVYTTHGDLWDYLFDQHLLRNELRKTYLPWTLELGSWAWVRKNPTQLFSALGGFNPILPHRHRRIMRRHMVLLDFFFRATSEWKSWIQR